MSRITFYGASDDLVEVTGYIYDEFGVGMSGVWEGALVDSHGEGLRVSIVYTSEGTWSAGVAPLDEEVPLPLWPISFEMAETGYSTAISITVPDGTTLTEVSK
jgi:hypothetical protein